MVVVVSVCGFKKTAATTLEMLYLQKEIIDLGEKFELIVFDNVEDEHLHSVSGNKFIATIKLFLTLLKTDFDLVQIAKASPYVGFPALVASKLRGKKAVVLLDDYERGITTKRHGRLAGALMGLCENLIIRSSDHNICASEFIFEKAKRLNRNSTFIPFGIPAGRFKKTRNMRKKLGLREDDNVLIYVGSLTKDADADIAIEALKWADAKLLILGGGEAEDNLKVLAGELGVAGRVIFCGWQKFKDVPDFISSSDICVIPMREMDIDRARCPMKLLEYIAAEKPIVGGDVGMVSFFLRQGAGLLCRPNDPKDMGEKISKIMAGGLGACIKKGARKLKDEYSWKRVAERYLDVYRRVIG